MLVLLASAVLLRAQTDPGTIRGHVYGQTRAVLPGVTVTAPYQGRGATRETFTSDLGEYVLSRIDPGLYTLRFDFPGFAPYAVQDLEVPVGQIQTFSAKMAAAAEAIEITAEATRITVAHDKTQQSNHIDSVSIEDLPINRRDYRDLALLTPGVVDSSYVADDRDQRLAPTPASGLGIGGGGRGNTFTIDGLTLSGIVTVRSFAPFDLNAGYDNVGDRHTNTHRPWSVGRNVGHGPDYFTVDMRVKRQFPLIEDRSLDVVVEGFNLLNRTNFRKVESTVDTLALDELPSSYEGRRGPVTKPFSYTSGFLGRQFQVSLRISF